MKYQNLQVLYFAAILYFLAFIQQIMMFSTSVLLCSALGSLFALEAGENVRSPTLRCQNRGYSKQTQKPSKMQNGPC